MYSLSHQPSRNALSIVIEGFWTLDTFSNFERDVVDFVRRLTQHGRHHMVLVNVAGTAIQTQEVIRNFQLLIEMEEPQPRKIAFIAPTALSRMQTRRLVIRDNIRLFQEVADAERWLDQPTE